MDKKEGGEGVEWKKGGEEGQGERTERMEESERGTPWKRRRGGKWGE